MSVQYVACPRKRPHLGSRVYVTVKEIPRFHGQLSDFDVEVARYFPLKNRRVMECVFSAGKMASGLANVLAGIVAKPSAERSSLDCAVLADAIEEDQTWQSPAKDLRWFLDQLRIVGGVQLVGSRA